MSASLDWSRCYLMEKESSVWVWQSYLIVRYGKKLIGPDLAFVPTPISRALLIYQNVPQWIQCIPGGSRNIKKWKFPKMTEKIKIVPNLPSNQIQCPNVAHKYLFKVKHKSQRFTSIFRSFNFNYSIIIINNENKADS